MTGVTARTRRDGSIAYEAQVRRPRPLSPLSKTFATREQAQRWHDDTLSKTRTVPEAPHTLATWTAAWLPDSHLTPGAQRYTRERLRLHVFPVLGRTLLTDIRPTHLNRLYRNLRKVTGGELSHATVVRLHGVLSQVLRAAAAEGLIEANPTADVRLPRRTAPAREIEAWSATQVTAFLSQPAVQASPLHSLFLVAFHTGMRRGELLGLTPAEVKLTGELPIVKVRRSLTDTGTGWTKTDSSNRRIPLTPAAAAVLREQLQRRADGPHQAPQLWLDSRGRALALSPTAVSKAFQRLADAFVGSPAGLSARATRLTLHGARHSYVTNLLADGLDMATVSKLAGHSSVAFTVKQYYKLLDEHAAAAARLYA